MRRLTVLIIFGISMGFIESAVVAYLRFIAYPGTTSLFPLALMPPHILKIEIWREVATISMLLSVAYISARIRRKKRLFYFMLLFGIWDISYYFWLKVLINWPTSPLSWDILFLIPFPWTSPVIYPIIISIIFIFTSIIFIGLIDKKQYAGIDKISLSTGISGLIIIFFSFISTSVYITLKYSIQDIFQYIPGRFPLEIYLIGLFLFLYSILRTIIRSYLKNNGQNSHH